MSWQRVESSTIDPDLDEGLAARVADAYWMLARQWQVGEFRGEDAANPMFIELVAESIDVDLLRLGPKDDPGPPILRATSQPMEPAVEAESILDTRGHQRLAAEAAHALISEFRSAAELDATAVTTLIEAYRTRYPLSVSESGQGSGTTDRVGQHRLRVLGHHLFDGVAALEEMVIAPNDVIAWGAGLGLTASQAEAVGAILPAWALELGEAFVTPSDGQAWNPQRMEYEFQVAASLGQTGGGIALSSQDYGGGRLDWFGFNLTGALPPLTEGATGIVTHRSEVLPQPLAYSGMPASRFWEFEDGEVHFGGIDAAPEDLARLSLAAYATVYGDDWYLVPLTLPAQSLTAVTSVRVLDDFGGDTSIDAAAVLDGPGRAFRFFELSGDPSAAIGRTPILFLPPTVETADAGRPIDDVRLGRDETANLAWGVEQRIESTYGRGVDPLLDRNADEPKSNVVEADGDEWTFRLSGDVPDNWVPFVPVRLGAGGAIGLQRGRMPIHGTEWTRGAQSQLFEPDDRLVVEESEIPVSGVRIVRRFQSARSADGGLHVWLGRQKGPGRPEPESGFVFDSIDMRTER